MRAWIATLVIAGIPGCSSRSAERTSTAKPPAATAQAGADEPAIEMVIRADHNEPQTRWKGAPKKARYIDKKDQEKSSYAASSKSQDAHNGFGDGAPAAAAPQAALDNVGVSSVASMQGFQGSRVQRTGIPH